MHFNIFPRQTTGTTSLWTQNSTWAFSTVPDALGPTYVLNPVTLNTNDTTRYLIVESTLSVQPNVAVLIASGGVICTPGSNLGNIGVAFNGDFFYCTNAIFNALGAAGTVNLYSSISVNQ